MSSPADNDDSVDSPTSPGGVANPVKKDLATLYQTYKQEHGLPENTDNCLFYIHFLLEQNTSENGVIWLWRDNEATSFQVLDKFAFAKRYGALSDANKAPKYDSIRRLLNNYDFHCDKKIIWTCNQAAPDGKSLFRPSNATYLQQIRKKTHRTTDLGENIDTRNSVTYSQSIGIQTGHPEYISGQYAMAYTPQPNYGQAHYGMHQPLMSPEAMFKLGMYPHQLKQVQHEAKPINVYANKLNTPQPSPSPHHSVPQPLLPSLMSQSTISESPSKRRKMYASDEDDVASMLSALGKVEPTPTSEAFFSRFHMEDNAKVIKSSIASILSGEPAKSEDPETVQGFYPFVKYKETSRPTFHLRDVMEKELGATDDGRLLYRSLQDVLATSAVAGFIHEVYFLINPKSRVGPLQQLFETVCPRANIDYLVVAGGSHWLCWGTLIDGSNLPALRSTNVISDDDFAQLKPAELEQRRILKEKALLLRSELEMNHVSGLADARESVARFDLPLALLSHPPLDDLQDLILNSRWQKIVLLSKNNGIPIVDDSIMVTPALCSQILRYAFHMHSLQPNVEQELIKLFVLFTSDPALVPYSMSHNSLTLTLKRFGVDPYLMFAHMANLLSTGCFTGALGVEQTLAFLNECPEGSYLIRYSQSSPGFCVCWKAKDKVDQMNKITYNDLHQIAIDFPDGTHHFDSWSDIIEAAPDMRRPVTFDSKVNPFDTQNHGILLEILDRDTRFSKQNNGVILAPPKSNTVPKRAEVLRAITNMYVRGTLTLDEFTPWVVYFGSMNEMDLEVVHSSLQLYLDQPQRWLTHVSRALSNKMEM